MKTTKNYSMLNGPSHQCQYYSEDRVCLHPDGPDVDCEFYVGMTGKVCEELFKDTGMCQSIPAQNNAKENSTGSFGQKT